MICVQGAIQVLLGRRIEGICKVGCILKSVLWVGICEKGKFEQRLKEGRGPGQVAWVVGASSVTPKCCRLGHRTWSRDLWSGHTEEATDQCFCLTLMFLSLSKKKKNQ